MGINHVMIDIGSKYRIAASQFLSLNPLSPHNFYLHQSRRSQKSLLEEGNVMASLTHDRVVKLLGVIMEDRDCSLVMELIPRGNLSSLLETVSAL